MLVQQHQANSRATAKAIYEKAHTKLSPSSLQTITPLDPITVTPSSGSATQAASDISGPPQPSKSSGSQAQGAGQHSTPVQINIQTTLNQAKAKLGL